MAILKSGASTDELTIDAVSKAARGTPYDTRGTNRGVKITYSAATAALLVAPASTAPFFVIQGSGTKTIRIQRIAISGLTLTAVAYANIQVAKYSTAVTAGTATALTAVPHDSNDAAATASLINVYTAAPTPGTLTGVVRSRRELMQATTAAAAGIPNLIEFDFRNQGEADGLVLRGTAQGLGLRFEAAPATAVSMGLHVEWTEE